MNKQLPDKAPHYDVFLSYSLSQAESAAMVTMALKNGGLQVFDTQAVEAKADLSERVRAAIIEAAALVAVVAPGEFPSLVAVEMGAAEGWGRPVFVVRTPPLTEPIPAFLEKYPVYPLSRLDDLVKAVRNQLNPLTSDEQRLLIAAYADMGVTVDEMLDQPALVDRLAEQFNHHRRPRRPGEQLVRALMGLQKRGQLRRVPA